MSKRKRTRSRGIPVSLGLGSGVKWNDDAWDDFESDSDVKRDMRRLLEREVEGLMEIRDTIVPPALRKVPKRRRTTSG